MSTKGEFDWDVWGSKVRASLGPRQPAPQKKGGVKKRTCAGQPRPSGSEPTVSTEYHK